MKKKIRVVIYIRYSSHRQAGSFSVEYQLAECKKHIERSGYELVEVYIDEAKTGKKTAGREAFDSMMFDASLNKFDKIIVFSFSRSFRNTRDALNYNYELQEKYGIVIESVIERIDMTDPHGKFSGTNLFAMHELQSDITAAHVKSGMYFAAQQGYYLGGYVPFGYELYGTSEFSRGKERKVLKSLQKVCDTALQFSTCCRLFERHNVEHVQEFQWLEVTWLRERRLVFSWSYLAS